MIELLLVLACLNGFAVVLLSALGSHAFTLTDESRHVFDLALQMQAWHAAPLLMAALLARLTELREIRPAVSGWLWLAGILCFSGTLYGRAAGLLDESTLITPVGGWLLMAGWLWPIIRLLIGKACTRRQTNDSENTTPYH